MTEETAAGDGALARQIAGTTPGEAQDAESALYRRYARRARLFGLRHLRDAQAAEDLAQEAMMISIEKLRAGAIEDPNHVGAFILGTCRMLMQARMRTERRRRDILDRFPVAEPTQPDEPRQRDDAAMRRLKDCMRGLAERARTVVLLTFYAERSTADIARELRINPGNVRVIRHRALADLQACMKVPT